MKFMLVKREPLSWMDGISQFLFSLSDALLRLGHEVVCVASCDSQLATVRQNYDFSRYPEIAALSEEHAEYAPKLAARLWRRAGKNFVAQHRPDLILLNGALPVRFARPTVLIAHDLQQRKFFGDFGRRIFKAVTYRLADQLVVTCPELVVPTAKDALCPRGRFLVVPTCIDTQRYTPRPLAERAPVILHLGFIFYKAPRATLAAFAAMKNRNARLVLVGRPDAEVAAEIQALPAELRGRIEMPGSVSAEKLKELMGTARIVSVPSHYDLPVASPTVLEALASHTPAVVSAGISRLVAADGENCFVEDTTAGMARRFDELLADDETWLKISAGCAATKLQFDSLTVARQYIELAQKLSSKKC